MDKIVIYAVVPVYNPKDAEIYNIMSYISKFDGTIIMDDSETNNDSAFKFLYDNPDLNCRYYWNGQNIGLTRSVNKGFKHAIDMGATWILVIDQDGRFATDIVSVYRTFLEKDSRNLDRLAVLLPQYNYDRHPRKKKNGFRRAKYGDMSGSLYNVNVLKALDFFDENTYFYGLEEEYYLRVRRNHYNIIQCMEAVINHNPAHTETYMVLGVFPFRYGKDEPERYYYQFRVAFYILLQRYGIRSLILLVYKSLKIYLFFDRKQEYLEMRRKAWIDYKRGYFGKYESRTI